MSENAKQQDKPNDLPEANNEIAQPTTARPTPRRRARVVAILYWCKFMLQPIIAIGAIAMLVVGIGFAQRMGFLTSADSDKSEQSAVDDGIEYVCPMLCVPPSKQPGRCPVCGMNLKARKTSSDSKDKFGLTISPASRRLSNIQTVVAATMPLTKRIKALGRIGQDETSKATISAYVDGRLEKLMIDFTGARVSKGQELALLYSPELYSTQIELLAAKKAMESSDSNRPRIVDSNLKTYQSTRRRLIEFGLPESQVDAIERAGEANSRIKIVSPISGTVTEKLADEGQYLKTGSPILRVVDLSEVWLMLELFPEDASLIRYGQQVSVSMQSHPGRDFEGRVAFIDPQVDTKTQTVPVRVVIPNDAGLIRIGDYAQAVVHVEVTAAGDVLDEVYDPSLAGKWISPMHPQIVRDQPGVCPLCGVDLVPASQFGYVSFQTEHQGSIVVPRSSVLMAGEESVVYVETKPGRFEFRRVEIGQIVGDQVAIVSGISPGEMVVSKAAYRIDAAFNMAGKPSLIDPKKAVREDETQKSVSPEQMAAIKEALSKLSDADRTLAEKQKTCPVTGFALGSMGVPIRIAVEGRDVLVCCDGCRDRLVADPQKYFAILDAPSTPSISPDEAAEIELALAPLSAEDRKLVEAQVFCPVADFRLGGMGTPIKLELEGQPVFICCEGCRADLENEPQKYLDKLKLQKESGIMPTGKDEGIEPMPQMNVPQMELPKMELPKMELPKMELPK